MAATNRFLCVSTRASPDRCKSKGLLGAPSSGLKILCFKEPSFPHGTLKGGSLRSLTNVGVFAEEGGLYVDGGERNVPVLLAVGVVGEYVSRGERGGGGTKFDRIIGV